jgi:hypothetical protein
MFILPNLSSIAIYSRASNQMSTLFAYAEILIYADAYAEIL